MFLILKTTNNAVLYQGEKWIKWAYNAISNKKKCICIRISSAGLYIYFGIRDTIKLLEKKRCYIHRFLIYQTFHLMFELRILVTCHLDSLI